MMRALYSGVAGLKTHMQRMDVIGNNIANVNTYGFKSSRATFRDMYYQQVRGASAGTMTRGGVNPSEVGYGSQLSSIDLLMGSSSFTSTGNQLDVAITGEGFLQVQDPEGNIFYTKAGMLDIDTEGRLVDTNGYFVLGTSATSGQLNSTEPGKSIIAITVDPVEPQYGALETTLLGKALKITSSVQSELANVSFTFSASKERSDGTEFFNGEKLEVIMESGNPNIAIRLNESEKFGSAAELSKAINDAIKATYGGDYPGGEFTFELKDEDGNDAIAGLTGGEIATSKSNATLGSFSGTPIADPDGTAPAPVNVADWKALGLEFPQFGSEFSGNGNFSIEISGGDPTATPPNIELTITVDSVNDDGTITQKVYKSGTNGNKTIEGQGLYKMQLDGGGAEDYIGIRIPQDAFDKLCDTTANPNLANAAEDYGTFKKASPSTTLGLGKQTWTLEGGTEGGPQSYENLTGISIGSDGTIIGSHPVHGRLVLGRIDLANFANPAGLEQTGNSYFMETENSGEAQVAIPGEDGTGAIRNSALEMSNVDLAQEFTDMIVTQRGYQANSRVITVSDTMLEELINLKR